MTPASTIPSILLIEDDTAFALMLQKWFEKNAYAVKYCASLKTAREALSSGSFDLILSDLRLPDGESIELLESDCCKTVPMMLMSSYADITKAVAAMKLGAVDFLEKPIHPDVLRSKLDYFLEKRHIGPMVESETEEAMNEVLTGISPKAQQMYEHIRLVAPTRLTVLILGESGTGKEHAAQMIHKQSTRKEGPFVAIDCGSLSKELAISELFGHKKGAFTSAISDKKGAFELAQQGTLFLDEIGNLSYEVQVQLLRAIQEQLVRPLGGTRDIPIDVRIIAATNENIEDAVSQNQFRLDLLHRLNEFEIHVPALRERMEDISLFVQFFIKQANRELSTKVEGISSSALQSIMSHPWPGNIRELRNAVRRAVLFAQKDHIELEHLPQLKSSDFNQSHPWFDEKERVKQALQQAQGNKSEAARILKIDRKTLYNKMARYDIVEASDCK